MVSSAELKKAGADPQNLAWRKDSGGYGYRMLAMMGWSEGKGLGAKEDGITQNVKVVKREVNLGLGADVNTSDNWLANTSAFDGILSRLNSRTSVKENLAKMQEVSAPKKATGVTNKRLRYHKLVKAKTLSNHKAEDISAILVPQKPDDDDYDAYSITPLTDKKRKLEEIEEKEQNDKEDEITTKTKKQHTTKSKKSKTKTASKSKKSKARSDSESSDSDSNSDADSASSDSDSNSDSDASSSSSSDSGSSSSESESDSDSDRNSDSDSSSNSSSNSDSSSDSDSSSSGSDSE